jgi:KaiC/GvpD/RAD55 family RecA-like ATPase
MTYYHAVRFYDSSESIGRVVAAFLGGGFTRGEPGLVIATAEHRASVHSHLRRANFWVSELERSRRLLMLDAADTLSAIVVNGTPDPVRFTSVAGALLDEVSETSHGHAHVYDEMVDVLWKTHQQSSAIRLENLWSRLVATRECSLLCGHGPDGSNAPAQVLFAEHTHVVAENGVPHIVRI